jgi:hypothetical protein
MPFIFSLLSLALAGLLYVWYLRLAARWTLKTSLNRKVCWIFVGFVFVLTLANLAMSAKLGQPTSIAIGAFAHLLLGGWYFGRFAINSEKQAPGFLGGIKVTGVAMLLLGGTSLVFVALPSLLLSSRA